MKLVMSELITMTKVTLDFLCKDKKDSTQGKDVPWSSPYRCNPLVQALSKMEKIE